MVLSDPLRLKIVTELNMREMSPTLFFARFGGGSVPRVNRHFQVLAKHGWLRLVRRAGGGKRYGGVEHFYRASKQAVFDNETWAELPYSIRAAFSSMFLEQFADRVTEAMKAGTFDSRAGRHFTWTPILLDQIGWERVIAAIDALFESLFEEQDDAKLRVHNSGEEPFFATVALMGFESPRPDLQDKQAGGDCADPAQGAAYKAPSGWRIAKVFSDPLCLKIMTELSLRKMSATGFHREFGGASRSGIHRRFKMLVDLGWLRKVGEKSGGKRRGGVEQYFRATGPVIFDQDDWSDVSQSIRSTYSWTIFEQLYEQVEGALKAGTVDARSDRHLSWTPLLLDEMGWENAIEALDAFFAFIFEEQAAAEVRVVESGEERMRVTVALAGFESPKDSAKAP